MPILCITIPQHHGSHHNLSKSIQCIGFISLPHLISTCLFHSITALIIAIPIQYVEVHCIAFACLAPRSYSISLFPLSTQSSSISLQPLSAQSYSISIPYRPYHYHSMSSPRNSYRRHSFSHPSTHPRYRINYNYSLIIFGNYLSLHAFRKSSRINSYVYESLMTPSDV